MLTAGESNAERGGRSSSRQCTPKWVAAAQFWGESTPQSSLIEITWSAQHAVTSRMPAAFLITASTFAPNNAWPGESLSVALLS
jgi:hypothetical protein